MTKYLGFLRKICLIYRLKLDFRVKPQSTKDGIIMYCAEKADGSKDFASVTLRNGHLEFRFDTGSGMKH